MPRLAFPAAAAVFSAAVLVLSSALVAAVPYAFVTGRLEVAVAEDFAAPPAYESWLRTDSGRVPLDLAPETALAYAGSNVKVKLSVGNPAVARAGVPVGARDIQRLSVATAPAAAGLKVAVLLVNFSNNTSQPYTTAAATDTLLNKADSVRNFLLEESRGTASMSGQVFGWYTIPATNAGCAWSTWGEQARAAATSAGVDLSVFSNVVVAWPSASCGWSGLGYVGGPYTFINGSFTTRVVAHELGHNFGLMHANSTSCTSSGARVAISTSCTNTEYGDPFSIMGTGGIYHDHGAQVGELGWLRDGELQSVSSDGTYQLTSLLGGVAGTTHLLRIPRGNGTSLFLDYRVPFGTVFDRFAATSPAVLGVMVRTSSVDATSSGSFYATSLVDATPETSTFWDAPLPVGRSLYDPIGRITLTTLTVGAGMATVRVEFGGAPAPSGSPTRTPSPTQTPSPTPARTPSPTATRTPSPAPTLTPSPAPTSAPTAVPSATPVPTGTFQPTPPPTPAPTPSPSPTSTPSATPPTGQVTLVQTIGTATLSRSGNSGMSLTVPASGVSAGNRVVVAAMVGTFKGTVGCTDSRGNVYAVDADVTSTGRLFVCSTRTTHGLAPGDTISMTYPGFSGTTVAMAVEFTGLGALDQRATAVGNGPRPSFGPVAVTGAPALLVSAVAHGATPVFAFGCGFTPVGRAVAGAGSGQRNVDLGFQIVAAPGSYPVCGTLSASAQWQGAVLAYR